mmetsp:Transcript_20099/g.43629  ORF Transcript_20099/g.43629 Transcript_20099/m.43629 type:complete len:1039 (+) Transcript_20099:138-3254(+)
MVHLVAESAYEELAKLFRRDSFFDKFESSKNQPRVTLEDVQRVAQECPGAFLLTDKRGDTLLHQACYSEDLTVEILALLHEMNPAAIDQATPISSSRRRFPKECMMYNRRAPPDVFSFLVENSKDGVSARQPFDFYLEMRFLCQNERFPVSASKLRSIVEACPEVVRMQTHHPELPNSDTPLQILCTNETATLEAVAYLYEAYPDAISLGDHGLPLHKACGSGLSLEIIEFLTHHYPEALRVNHHSGTPLHCHLDHCMRAWQNKSMVASNSTDGESEMQSSGVNIKLVRRFVGIFPQALEVIVEHEGTPLQTLLRMLGRFSDNTELIALTIEMAQISPAALRVQNDRSSPLLYYLCDRHRGGAHIALARAFVDIDPTLLNFPTLAGQLPIHAVCKNFHSTRIELLKYIIDRAPETVIVAQVHGGNLPIHDLLSAHSTHRVSQEALQSLVECNDSMLKVANSSGDLAVHKACGGYGESSTLHNVQYLVTKCPESTKVRNSIGCAPLDIAISMSHQDTVDFLLEKDPDIALDITTEGVSSFHRACRNGSLETIKKIHKLRLNLPRTVTVHQRLPLVFAIRGEQDLHIIFFLIQEYPNSILSRDSEGALPFHHACLVENPDMTLIEALFKFYPAAIHIPTNDGRLLMQILCGMPIESRATLKVLQFLACQLPYSLGLKDAEDRYPLHRFCQKIVSYVYDEEMTRVTFAKLHELNPDAIRHESGEFGLPIHCACKNGCGLEMLKQMVELYPQSIDHNHSTLGLPLHAAIERHDEFEFLLEKRYSSYAELHGRFLLHAMLEDETIDRKEDLANALLRILAIRDEHDSMGSSFSRGKAIERSKDFQGRLPLHLAVSVPGGLDEEFIEKLIGMYPGALYEKDHHGMLPLHHAFQNGAPVDTMYMLMNHGSDAMTLPDNNNCFPFHHGCQYHREQDFMEDFMNNRDYLDHIGLDIVDLCKERANNGDLPLHKACLGGNLDCISTLVAAHPLALKTRNHAGMLPVFLLCQELGKKKNDFEAAEERYIGAIFDLLIQNPGAILLSAQP